MADYLVTDTELTSVANAIRSKSGGNNQLVFPSGFVSELNGIDLGYTIDQIASKNFGSDANIIINGTTIQHYAFYKAVGIASVTANNVTSLGSGNAISIFNNSSIQSLTMNNLTSIGNSQYFCANCSHLTTIKLPLIWDLGDYAFTNCGSLVAVSFPSAIGSYRAFYGCSKLEIADYGGIGTNIAMNYQNFYNCTKFKTLIMRNTNNTNLTNVNAFDNTPFKSGGSGGTIYIPKSLYDHLGDGTSSDYQSLTNWSTIHARGTITWAQIEGSYYETHYADGTEIPTS